MISGVNVETGLVVGFKDKIPMERFDYPRQELPIEKWFSPIDVAVPQYGDNKKHLPDIFMQGYRLNKGGILDLVKREGIVDIPIEKDERIVTYIRAGQHVFRIEGLGIKDRMVEMNMEGNYDGSTRIPQDLTLIAGQVMLGEPMQLVGKIKSGREVIVSTTAPIEEVVIRTSRKSKNQSDVNTTNVALLFSDAPYYNRESTKTQLK